MYVGINSKNGLTKIIKTDMDDVKNKKRRKKENRYIKRTARWGNIIKT